MHLVFNQVVSEEEAQGASFQVVLDKRLLKEVQKRVEFFFFLNQMLGFFFATKEMLPGNYHEYELLFLTGMQRDPFFM